MDPKSSLANQSSQPAYLAEKVNFIKGPSLKAIRWRALSENAWMSWPVHVHAWVQTLTYLCAFTTHI